MIRGLGGEGLLDLHGRELLDDLLDLVFLGGVVAGRGDDPLGALFDELDGLGGLAVLARLRADLQRGDVTRIEREQGVGLLPGAAPAGQPRGGHEQELDAEHEAQQTNGTVLGIHARTSGESVIGTARRRRVESVATMPERSAKVAA